MDNSINTKKLNSSWTKYDIVKLVDIDSIEDLDMYISGLRPIESSVLKAFIGINNLSEELPSFWKEIRNHPKYFKIFTLIAAITTHYSVLEKMSRFASKGNMIGEYIYENHKLSTNLRSALVVSGAALQKYRRSENVPYTLASLFENGEIGLILKSLFTNRLTKVGYTCEQLENSKLFFEACDKINIISALSLTKEQFIKWMNGESLDIENEIFTLDKLKGYSKIPMLRVNQWMNDWDDIDFNSDELRKRPKPYFYIFSIDARLLKRLSDVHSRNTDRTSPQRKRSDARVREISNYIEGGFPWSTLSSEQQKIEEHIKLKMPGLLPTAIILNILSPDEKRNGKKIDSNDCLFIEDKLEDPESFDKSKKDIFPTLNIPDHIFNNEWKPELKPIEIIDGQHRLWAFDETQNFNGNYELPVVAFYNLDRAWQAYLFYTINIKPVRINTSLGFDLYPMLRTQKWLEASKDGVLAYRESRAQELVELLWLYPNSAWYNRINMLGESGGPTMSQAAFVRTLINSFFRKQKGLYASELVKNEPQVLNWNRAQQAAFLILIWGEIEVALRKEKKLEWANQIRTREDNNNLDLAFVGKDSFLSRDQGVRPIMVFINDFFFTLMDESIMSLNKFLWEIELDERVISNESIDYALDLFKSDKDFYHYVQIFAENIIKIDWRTPSAPFASEEERKQQLIYKGSGGYSEYYNQIVSLFRKSIDKKLRVVINKMI